MLKFVLRPWHLLVLFVASQLNREQQRVSYALVCVVDRWRFRTHE